MRNMESIMKLHFLAPQFRKLAEKARVSFDDHVTEYSGEKRGKGWELFSCMEYADRMFKAAAEQKFFTLLANRCEQTHLTLSFELAHGTLEQWKAEVAENSSRNERARLAELTEENCLDITWEEIAEWVHEEHRYLSPLPRSSSPSHNLMEATMLQVVMDFQRDRFAFWSCQRDAQRQDSEYQEWARVQNEAAKLHRQQEELKKAMAEQEVVEAKRRVKRYVQSTAAVSYTNMSMVRDVLRGWPTAAEGDRIRINELWKYVREVHRTYVLKNGEVVKRISPSQATID